MGFFLEMNGERVPVENGVAEIVIKKNGNIIAPEEDGSINLTTEGGDPSDALLTSSRILKSGDAAKFLPTKGTLATSLFGICFSSVAG